MSETSAESIPGRGAAHDRSRLYRTEAIVLRRRDLGEADRILTLYTQSRGKIRAVAKGVRRTKSRLAGHLEPFSRTSLLIARGRNLDIVTQAAMLDPMAQLRTDELSIAYAGYFADLLDALTPDEAESPRSYEALVVALTRLDRGRDRLLTARYFEVTLLRVLGFRPELYQCITCGQTLEPVVNGFSVEGGVVCAACRHGDPHATPISVNALKLLRLLDRGDLDTVDRLRLSPELMAETEHVLGAHLRHLLERELSSWSVLKTIEHTATRTG